MSLPTPRLRSVHHSETHPDSQAGNPFPALSFAPALKIEKGSLLIRWMSSIRRKLTAQSVHIREIEPHVG